MKFQIMMCCIVDDFEGLIYEDRFLPDGERNYTVGTVIDSYLDEESGAGYDIWEVEASRPEDIIKYIGDTKHQLSLDQSGLPCIWTPIE